MKLNIKELALFSMLGTFMFVSRLVMQLLPNIHLLGALIVAITLVYRAKALFPIYIYVFLEGIFSGWALWWIPYLYIWTVLWGFTMLLPKMLPNKLKPIVYIGVCALHGFLFGTLYAPAQALLFGLDFKGMISWIITGLPADAIHGVSNLFCGILILPIAKILHSADKYVKN